MRGGRLCENLAAKIKGDGSGENQRRHHGGGVAEAA